MKYYKTYFNKMKNLKIVCSYKLACEIGALFKQKFFFFNSLVADITEK